MHKCKDCKIPAGKTHEFYYLHDEIWAKIARKDEDLCIQCAEHRLGRKLRQSDFTDCFINQLTWGTKSERLKSRLLSTNY